MAQSASDGASPSRNHAKPFSFRPRRGHETSPQRDLSGTPTLILVLLPTAECYLLFLYKITCRYHREPLGIKVLAERGIDGFGCQRLDLLFKIGLKLHGPADK